MGSRENLKQKKNKKSCKIFGIVEGVYSKAQQLEKRRRFEEYKKSSSKI